MMSELLARIGEAISPTGASPVSWSAKPLNEDGWINFGYAGGLVRRVEVRAGEEGLRNCLAEIETYGAPLGLPKRTEGWR